MFFSILYLESREDINIFCVFLKDWGHVISVHGMENTTESKGSKYPQYSDTCSEMFTLKKSPPPSAL